ETLLKLAEAPNTARQPPQSQLLLSASLRRHGRLEQALALLERACEVHPNDFGIHFNLAWLNSNVRPPRREAAVRHGLAARALRPQSAPTWVNLGLYLKELRKLDEAVACYQKAIELDPKDASVYTNLGVALRGQKKLEEAVAAHRKAIEIAPSLATAYSNLGVALRAQKKPDEAARAYRKAIEIDPKLAPAYYNLGLLLREQKKWDQALAAHLKAIAVDLKANASTYLGVGSGFEAD